MAGPVVDKTVADEALTRREEEEVLRLTGGGLSNKEIARELNLSMATVKQHVHTCWSNRICMTGCRRCGGCAMSRGWFRQRRHPDFLCRAPRRCANRPVPTSAAARAS